MKSEIKRKLFHLLSLIYVIGIASLPRPRFIALTAGLFLINIIFELVRLNHPPASEWIYQRLGGLFRPEEKSKFTGVFWMLLGVLTTAVLIKPPRVAMTIFFYVILGDGVASLVGKGVGGPRWPGSKKTVSGSLACFLVCLGMGILLLRPDFGWSGIAGGAFLAAILEFGLFQLNDNFAIPAGCSLVFLLIYGLKPVFIK